MSDLLEVSELDLESELNGDGHAHALPFCVKHKGAEFYPAPGSIVETICGKLIRLREFLGNNISSRKCPKCSAFQGKILHCYYCGADVVG